MAIVVYCFRFGDRYFVHIYLKERDFFFWKTHKLMTASNYNSNKILNNKM